MAKVYKGGEAVSRCTVFIGDRYTGGGIGYSSTEATERNSYNEMLSVESDDQSIYLRGLGMTTARHGEVGNLSQEGAAEFYWALLIEPLQQRNR